MSTRWYVLPLLQQQNEVNRLLVQQLQEQQQMVELQQSLLIAQSREQSDLIHDLGVMQVQLHQLQQQITELTARLEKVSSEQ